MLQTLQSMILTRAMVLRRQYSQVGSTALHVEEIDSFFQAEQIDRRPVSGFTQATIIHHRGLTACSRTE
jgi:hypothetical protein